MPSSFVGCAKSPPWHVAMPSSGGIHSITHAAKEFQVRFPCGLAFSRGLQTAMTDASFRLFSGYRLRLGPSGDHGLVAGPIFGENRIALRIQMKPEMLIFQSTRRTIVIATLIYLGTVSSGTAQTMQLLDVPKELFASFCYFSSGVYSPGATFCTKTGTSLLCKGPNKDNNFAMWTAASPDEGCQSSPPLPPK
jgi:hypothetical protein